MTLVLIYSIIDTHFGFAHATPHSLHSRHCTVKAGGAHSDGQQAVVPLPAAARGPALSVSLARASPASGYYILMKRSVEHAETKRLVGHSNTSTPSCVGTMSCA